MKISSIGKAPYLLVLVLTNIPDEIFTYLSLLHLTSPPEINYKWLDYHVSFISIFFIVLVFLNSHKKNTFLFIFSIFVLFLRDLYFHIYREIYVFNNLNVELYVSIFFAYGLFLTLKKHQLLEFLKVFLL